MVWQSRVPDGDPIDVQAVREISEFEHRAVQQVQTGLSPIPTIGTLRARHHKLARLIAAGTTQREAAKILGMSEVTVSLLKRSPQFANLLLHYMGREDDEALGIRELLKETALDALLRVSEKLEASVEEIPLKDLQTVAASLLDRAGFSPVMKTVSANIGVSREDLEEMKRASSASVVVARTITAASIIQPEQEADRSPDSSSGIDFASLISSEDKGHESTGASVRAEGGAARLNPVAKDRVATLRNVG